MAASQAPTEFFRAASTWPDNYPIDRVKYFFHFLFIRLHFLGKSLYFALMKFGPPGTAFRMRRNRRRTVQINPKQINPKWTRRVTNEERLRHDWSTHFG